MKKLISFIILAAVMLALAGCAAGNTQPDTTDDNTAAAQTEDEATEAAGSEAADADTDNTSSGGKALVAYFSRTGEQYAVGVIDKGNTAIIADMIAEATGADSFEILPETDNYPTTYKELTDYAKEEQNNNARPEVASEVEDMDSYDTIYLGYPIWWGDLPMICYTFLESYDLSGKTIVPFCTHEGSGDAGTQSKLQQALPGCEVKEVLAIRGQDAQNLADGVQESVAGWLAAAGE